MAEALERPLLLPKNMEALKHMRQSEFFLSLKRDLALVSSPTYSTKNGFPSSILFSILTYSSVTHTQANHEVSVAKEWVKDA